MTAGQLPEGRYGRRGSVARRWAVALGCARGARRRGGAVIGYRNLGTTPIQGEALGFSLLPGNAVQLRLNVIRDDPSRPAVCIVRARSRDGEETGRREVYVPARRLVRLCCPPWYTPRGHRSPLTSTDVRFQVPAYLVPAPKY